MDTLLNQNPPHEPPDGSNTSPPEPHPTGSDNPQSPWENLPAQCEALGIDLTPDALSLLKVYAGALTETNAVMNLVRFHSEEELVTRHLLDSLTLAPLIDPEAKVADIGSGGGLPSFPLAILRPDIQITAIESVQKKVKFLSETAKTLQFPPERFMALADRVELMGKNPKYREHFDVVTSRAVGRMALLVEYALPLLKLDGLLLAMKGRTVDAEIEEAKVALQQLGGTIEHIIEMDHPDLQGAFLVLVRKIKPTSPKFPRGVGVAAKQPLGTPPKSPQSTPRKDS